MIFTGMVLYNPDIDILKKSIDSVCTEVEKIICVDNNSKNYSAIDKLICNYNNIFLIRNSSNLGMAKALNQIFEQAVKEQCEWILLLDQDSICNNDMLKKMKKEVDSMALDETIAIVCPSIIDRNYKENVLRREKKQEKIVTTHYCINSGSLINTEIWEKVGGYDENLFVDLVDYDFNIRLKQSGYKIIKLLDAYLSHTVGEIEEKILFGKKFKVYNHGTVRKYDLCYANVYLAKKHKEFGQTHAEFTGLQNVYKRIIKRALLVILFEKNKGRKLIAMLKGTIDGRNLKHAMK